MKIIKLIKNIKHVKFKINKKNIVIFDGVSFKDLEYILKDYDYMTLEDRIDRIDTIYITPNVIINFFYYLFLLFQNYSLKSIYNIALIKSMSPKVVITSIDNSINFHLAAKILYKEIFFLAIQNANRTGYRELNYCLKKNIIYPKNYKDILFIPNLVCFGEDDISGSKKENLKILNFYNFGSVRISNFFYYLKEKNIEIKKDLYDVCLISEPMINHNVEYKNATIEKSIIDLMKFSINFCMENNLKFIYAPKCFFETRNAKLELDFFSEYLSKEQLRYLLQNTYKKINIYSSYEALLQSKIAIGWESTMLLNKIGLKQKILSCNFSSFETWNFPINGVCSLNEKDYKSFSERVKLILNMSDEDYFNKLNKNPNFVMSFDEKESLIKKTKKIIDKNL